uniref:Uncharacterized protein LOC111106445 n=1 Tax=Crassostrea virginica TaxID=6565 RepID=A0A8B8B1D2_CRAVI|nr:uncharacterized protein LOC111106445 [Crassostrea virginica]
MENKRGDPGLPQSWWSNDVTLMQRMCKDETAQGLDKLVPCANDMSVRQSILRSVADNTDIPPPRAEVTAEEAQRYVCRITKSCLLACLKTMKSSCDPRGVRTAVGVLSDLLQSPGDYKIPLLDLGQNCLTELLLLL